MTGQALIHVPKKAKRGEVIEIRTMISHVMETGFRRSQTGEPLPRNIITDFACAYNGVEVFKAELFPAMTANPFLIFHTVATESGTLAFKWTGDNGFTAEQSVKIEVE
jgi:sulfur-oxidizing protein SoxZ